MMMHLAVKDYPRLDISIFDKANNPKSVNDWISSHFVPSGTITYTVQGVWGQGHELLKICAIFEFSDGTDLAIFKLIAPDAVPVIKEGERWKFVHEII